MSASQLTVARQFLRVILNPLLTLFMAGALFLFCFRSFAVEPFDFDESIYRRMAEEMKAAGHWLSQPVFNGEAYNHKPPTYIAILASMSWILDGSDSQITAFAARFPSLIFSILTLWIMHRTWRRLTNRRVEGTFQSRRQFVAGVSPVLFLFMCFLPMVASTSVLLDPLLVLFTTVFLCSECVRIFQRQRDEPTSVFLSLASMMGMFGATATKGLIGLVLPMLSLFVFSAWHRAREEKPGTWNHLKCTFQYFMRHYFLNGLVAAVASFAFYYFLWSTGGSAFVSDFFLKHHFGRATSPMEGHDGSVFYYIIILIVGGGFALSWNINMSLLNASAKSIVEDDQTAKHKAKPLAGVAWFLLIWCGVCLSFFTLLATKLPNYIWPVWPAIALLASVGGVPLSRQLKPWLASTAVWCALFFPYVLPVLFVVLALTPFLWAYVVSPFLNVPPRESAMMATVVEHQNGIFLGFFMAAVLCWVSSSLLRQWVLRSQERKRTTQFHSLGVARCVATLQLSACAVLMLFSVPALEDVLTIPLQQSTAKARMFLGAADRLATADVYSPTVVSSNAGPVVLGIGDAEWVFADPKTTVVLTPIWKLDICKKHGFDVAQASEYLRICLRSYRRTLEGPGQ